MKKSLLSVKSKGSTCNIESIFRDRMKSYIQSFDENYVKIEDCQDKEEWIEINLDRAFRLCVRNKEFDQQFTISTSIKIENNTILFKIEGDETNVYSLHPADLRRNQSIDRYLINISKCNSYNHESITTE